MKTETEETLKSETHLIEKVIVHTIKRISEKVEPGTKKTKPDHIELDARKATLDVGETIKRVIDTLTKLYSNKAGKSHGKFENDLDIYPFSKHLSEYLKGNIDFVKATTGMANTLVSEIQKTASPGGHVFFAHTKSVSKENQNEYFIVAILNDELGAALSESKDVVDNLHLNVKGFRLAGRVNITAWKAGKEKYVSFLKGRGQDKVSDFFKLFIGCNNSLAAAIETKSLIDTLEEFCSNIEMSDDDKSDFMKKAYVACKKLSETDQPFDAEIFSNELFPQKPEELSEAIAQSNKNISDGFIPHKSTLNNLVKFSAKSKHWRVDFDRKALASGQIKFDEKNCELIITEIPQDLIDRLKIELQVAP